MFHISFNVPGELVEIFERVSLAAKIFHSVSGEMLLLRLNWGKIILYSITKERPHAAIFKAEVSEAT